MRIPSISAVNRESQPGSVPFRVRFAAAAQNREGPAKRSFRRVPLCLSLCARRAVRALSRQLQANGANWAAMNPATRVQEFGGCD